MHINVPENSKRIHTLDYYSYVNFGQIYFDIQREIKYKQTIFNHFYQICLFVLEMIPVYDIAHIIITYIRYHIDFEPSNVYIHRLRHGN